MVKLLSLFLLSQLSSALTPAQQAAIDQLIQQRRGAIPAKAGIGQLAARVKALEERMTPLVFLFDRLGPQVGERAGFIETLDAFLKDPANITDANPYADRAWLEKSHKEIMGVCCEIRRNPRVAKTVQENLGGGKPPLTADEYSTISERSRTVVLKPGRETIPTLPSRPDSKNAPKGFSNKTISGLPELSKPAATGSNAGAPGSGSQGAGSQGGGAPAGSSVSAGSQSSGTTSGVPGSALTSVAPGASAAPPAPSPPPEAPPSGTPPPPAPGGDGKTP